MKHSAQSKENNKSTKKNSENIIFRKRLLSVIGGDRDVLATAGIKLFTANNITNTWLYSDLQGHLCFILDHKIGAAFLILFDDISFNQLYVMELYKDFNKYYTSMTDLFHCFEVSNGCFIGFKFDEIKEAQSFLMIKKFDDNLIKMLLLNSNFKKIALDKPNAFIKNCGLLKNKFNAKHIVKSINIKFNKELENCMNSLNCTNNMTIAMPKNLNVVNFIEFNKDTIEFRIKNHAPLFIKTMFRNAGLKKSDLKNTNIMLYFIKHIIEYEKSNPNHFKLLSEKEDTPKLAWLPVRSKEVPQVKILATNIIKYYEDIGRYLPPTKITREKSNKVFFGDDFFVESEKRKTLGLYNSNFNQFEPIEEEKIAETVFIIINSYSIITIFLLYN